MTADTATDASGVEYYFEETTGNPGGADSGWQAGASYTDTGLNELTQYTYRVRARDLSSNQNTTGWSSADSATTEDGTAPGPDPMTWASVPAAAGPTSISMTADTATDPSGVEYYFAETSGNPGGNDSGWQNDPNYEDTGLSELTQYTYTVRARDKSTNQNSTADSAGASATTEDGTAPGPDPMTWASSPSAAGAGLISMRATTASDPSGVQYYFEEISGNPGGSDSGWQNDPNYEDAGLNELTQYTYRVRARDKSSNQNTTGWSSANSATTGDGTAPVPNPMTWAVMPYPTGPTSISMTATPATDPSGVEYYFANITDPNHDSTWQDSPTYEDTGLDDLTLYTYTARARDKSSNQNETVASTEASETTEDGTAPVPDPMTWAIVPSGSGPSSISMTATTATDPSGFEYYFDETSGNPGGDDSGWQNSPIYEDIGLDQLTWYTYTVRSRDKSVNQNITAWSSADSAMTGDGTPPEPNPMTWASVPVATGPTSISMTATTATDVSGVEYYFEETTGNPGGADSGWQAGASYTDTLRVPSRRPPRMQRLRYLMR
jgi:hypothetical protein